MKFYFKPVNKSKLGHSSSAKEQHKHFPTALNPVLIKNQSPTVTHNQLRNLVDSQQPHLPVQSSTVEEEPDIEPSLVKSVPSRPLISGSSILDAHLSLARGCHSTLKPKGTGELRVYYEPISKETPYFEEISEGMAHSLEDGTTAHINEEIFRHGYGCCALNMYR